MDGNAPSSPHSSENGALVHERWPFDVVHDEYISRHLDLPPFG